MTIFVHYNKLAVIALLGKHWRRYQFLFTSKKTVIYICFLFSPASEVKGRMIKIAHTHQPHLISCLSVFIASHKTHQHRTAPPSPMGTINEIRCLPNCNYLHLPYRVCLNEGASNNDNLSPVRLLDWTHTNTHIFCLIQSSWNGQSPLFYSRSVFCPLFLLWSRADTSTLHVVLHWLVIIK